MSEVFKDPKPTSPIVPMRLSLDDSFRFHCHKGVACFNECCRSIDIMLTPYDILRLKTRLGLTSKQFIGRHTMLFEMDAHGMPGLKMKTKEGSAECQFLTEQGCSVYQDRPAACRYYALGLTTMRAKDSPEDEDFYFVVKEPHCRGHDEPKSQTVREYRQGQGVDVYDEMSREWRQVVLKKRSCGPTLGRPSDRSFDLFFQASYDLDGFREFVLSESFGQVYDIDETTKEKLASDDVAMLQFAARFLKHALFGEKFLDVRPDAMEKRAARRRDILARQREQIRKEIEGQNETQPE